MKTKKIDCVGLKRRGAEKIYQQLQAMTREQQLAFWQARTLDLRQRQQRLKKDQPFEIVRALPE